MTDTMAVSVTPITSRRMGARALKRRVVIIASYHRSLAGYA